MKPLWAYGIAPPLPPHQTSPTCPRLVLKEGAPNQSFVVQIELLGVTRLSHLEPYRLRLRARSGPRSTHSVLQEGKEAVASQGAARLGVRECSLGAPLVLRSLLSEGVDESLCGGRRLGA